MPDDQFADPLGHRAADGDVVLQEQRLGAAHHQVVDDHRDQVEADGVVLVHRLGDRELGADAVGRATPAAVRGSRRAARTARRIRRARRAPRAWWPCLASGLNSSTARSPASMSTPADA